MVWGSESKHEAQWYTQSKKANQNYMETGMEMEKSEEFKFFVLFLISVTNIVGQGIEGSRLED